MSAAQRIIHLFLVFALAVFSLPIAASTGTATSLVEDACCSEDAACSDQAAPQANDNPADDDCCPGGCTHCFLSCCGASVCTLPSSVSLSAVDLKRGSIVHNLSVFPTIDPERIFHPPRL